MRTFFYSRIVIAFLFHLNLCYATQKSQNEPFNLVWQTDISTVYEVDWMHEILSELNYIEIADNNYSIFLDNSIIIVEASKSDRYIPYFMQLLEKGYKFGVILHSDEALQSPTDYYPNVRFVLRNYWRTGLEKYDNVMCFPIGYARDFWRNCSNRTTPTIKQRSYSWAFAGDPHKSTRWQMLHAMRRIPNGHEHTIGCWNAPDSLPRDQYRYLLLNAIFSPAPMGFLHHDSFRICEALECGCIPIVEKFPFDYFIHLFGPYPFPAISSWDEAPELIRALSADPIYLETLRRECYDWWQNYKKDLKHKIASFIEEHMKDSKYEE